ncbi:MAG TPA: rhomboid family intramembrane serine protease [Puia sp.]|nr:rhomboid family intramembrane serine protease [Puia sp.]
MTEFRPGGFQLIPPVIKNLVIINVLIFLAEYTLGAAFRERVEEMFGLHDIHSSYFRYYQLLTYLFIHASWEHVLYNMFALWMFGSILENYWGPKRFLTFYIICGLGAAIAHLAVLYPEMASYMDDFRSLPIEHQQELVNDPRFIVNEPTVGASGAIFGCLAAMGYLFPNSLIYLYFFVPIKVKWFVLGYAALELFSGVRATAGDNVAHWAHLGGGLVGLLLVIYWNRTNRRNFY